MKYWVKTANKLLHRKAFFEQKSEVVDYLKTILDLSIKSEKEYRLAALKEREETADPKYHAVLLKELKKWEGYNHQELMDSIVIVSVEEDMIEAGAFLSYT